MGAFARSAMSSAYIYICVCVCVCAFRLLVLSFLYLNGVSWVSWNQSYVGSTKTFIIFSVFFFKERNEVAFAMLSECWIFPFDRLSKLRGYQNCI